MRFWSGLVECGVFVMLVVLELALANCEFLFLDFNDNCDILLLLSSNWYIDSLDC